MLKRLHNIFLGALLLGAQTMVAMASDFSDVLPSHPNYTAIMDLKTRGFIGGYPDGTFKPDQVVNRVEALKIILNTAKITIQQDAAMGLAGFSDVDSSQWYAPYLRTALTQGIVQGYPDGTFRPTQTVNLVENLKILLNAKKVDLSALMVMSDPFADAFKDQWYAKFVQYAKEKKLIEANSNNMIFPDQGMTRGKLAETAYRLIHIEEAGLDYFGQVKDTSVPPTGGEWDGTLQVSIKDFGFNKSELIVPVGGKVKWVNNDSASHNVTSSTGKFASPTLSNGDSWTYTFNEEGTFEYFCSLHPSMTGKIIVKPANQVPTI